MDVLCTHIRIKDAGQESTSPFFPIERLKEYILRALQEATIKGAAHIRDPVGGSNANLFVYVTTSFCNVSVNVNL